MPVSCEFTRRGTYWFATTIILTILIYLVNMASSTGETGEGEQKTVLAFGGNGFIGSEVLARMIARNYKIFLSSRGNWYYDSETRIKPFVTHVICDRENSDLENCVELMKVINETAYFDYVLDFSAYKPEAISEAIEYLEGKVGVYVYMSSDSIYEVCERNPDPNYHAPSKETDAIRPNEEEEADRLNELDSYGDDKLAGEEVLHDNREKGGMKYLIFRLPDVVGPRDTTDRWYTYQMWIQLYDSIKIPLFIPPEVATLRTSYVYVKDVASAILLALDKGSEVWNQIYNLGLENDMTLQELLVGMSKAVGTNVEFNFEASERAFNLFPSVTRGSVDITKAKEILGFQPTDWDVVVKETVEFYKDAFFTFKSERDDVAHQLTRYVIPKQKKGEFLRLIDQLDGGLHTTKQEL